MPSSPGATQELLHDLRVHQIELELQNEELRLTQLELAASRTRYFDLYDQAPVGYFTLSSKGLIQDANGMAATLLGVDQRALAEQPLTRFILHADQDIYYQHRRRLSSEGARQTCELRFIKPNGDSRWVQLEATSVKDVYGDLVSRSVVSDIGARKHAEETLRLSEVRHRTLFEQSHDALMTLAPPTWQFSSGNSTTLAMFGVKDEASFVSHSLSDYSPKRQSDGGSSAEKAADLIAAALREGSSFCEWTCRRVSGQEFPASMRLTRIELDGQTLLQATVRDETETRKLQAMLAQADRLTSMGVLAAGVAHEINNPLTYVLHNLESLVRDLPKLSHVLELCQQALRSTLGDDAFAKVIGDAAPMLETTMSMDISERAQDALAGALRIKTISRAIGTFTHVESSERARIDLNDALQSVSAMVVNDIKFRAKLSCDFGVLPAIWASEGKLAQVFLNLLINAAHAIDEGDAANNEIRIRTWALSDDVFVEVRDSGKGIAKEHLERIFEPFFTTKAVGVGSGLGLSICRNIVRELGGDISAESVLGKGTCFTVRLPILRGMSSAPPPMRAPVVSSARGRILVVDDEPLLRKLMVRILEGSHEVVTASSGAKAQVILQGDQSFDVILCDLMMPEMTGMDLHRWLVAAYPALAERVVFLTGGAFTVNGAQYLASIKNIRLEKPCESATLVRVVSELVAAAHATP
jgi:two-component system cell cycle sensor histidine kinase/response regulator CckA